MLWWKLITLSVEKGAGRPKCDIIPKLYKMLTKFSNISQFNLQAWVVQEVDDEFYLSDKSSG